MWMDEHNNNEYTQCPRCKNTFSGDAEYCPFCGMKFGTGYSSSGIGCLSTFVGCGCIVLVAYLILAVLIPVLLWLSPLIIIFLLVLLLMKKG